MKEENNDWMDALFLDADKHFSKGEFVEGKNILEEILAQEPGYGRAHNHLGWLYYAKLDEYAKAEYHFRLAIRFAPAYPAAYMNLCYLLNYLNRYHDLKEHIARALTIEGTAKSQLYHELGKSHEVNGRYAEATEAYKEAIRFSLSSEEVEALNAHVQRVKGKTNLFEKRFHFF